MLDLALHPLDVRARQVDLVDRGDHLEVVLEGEVEVGERLGLDALARVDQQHRALAGRDRARDLVGEVHVARACRRGSARSPPPSAARYGMATAWLLIVMPRSRSMSMLSRIWSWKSRSDDEPRPLDEAVGQGGLAVVDVRDDAEVADVRGVQAGGV